MIVYEVLFAHTKQTTELNVYRFIHLEDESKGEGRCNPWVRFYDVAVVPNDFLTAGVCHAMKSCNGAGLQQIQFILMEGEFYVLGLE